MIELDGTDNKSKLGANGILAVSLAVARVGGASVVRVPPCVSPCVCPPARPPACLPGRRAGCVPPSPALLCVFSLRRRLVPAACVTSLHCIPACSVPPQPSTLTSHLQAGAAEKGVPLYRHIADVAGNKDKIILVGAGPLAGQG